MKGVIRGKKIISVVFLLTGVITSAKEWLNEFFLFHFFLLFSYRCMLDVVLITAPTQTFKELRDN